MAGKSEAVELSDKFLMSAGGWKVFGEARSLQRAGAVLEASYDPPLLKGKIRQGDKQFLAGLRILRRTEMENLCPCRDSKVRGIICAHSIAIGLDLLHPEDRPGPKAAEPPVPPGTDLPAVGEGSDRRERTTEVPAVLLEIEGSTRNLEATVKFTYSTPGLINPCFEEEVVQILSAQGLMISSRASFRLSGEDRVLWFYAHGLRRLPSEWEVRLGERLERVTREVVPIEPRFAIRPSDGGYFDLRFHFQAGDAAILPADAVRALLRSGRRTVELTGGRKGVADEAFLEDLEAVLRDIDPEQQAGGYRIASRHMPYLREAVADWTGTEVPAEEGAVALGSMEPLLRPYQREGVTWMIRRAREKSGGLLADDMGLGKTVQALAMLEVIGGPALVVCPSSLIWNWVAETGRFLPDLPVFPVVGKGREERLREGAAAGGLLVTSYPLLQRDRALYRSIRFRVVLLDEAQHIKNPETQNARTARTLQAEARFVLTGTPIENSIRDLWSLYEFLLPGYLGDKKDFEEQYQNPIVQEPRAAGVASTFQRLKRRIAPYFLRRTKAEHLADLPEKTEQHLIVELSANEKRIYNQLLEAARERVDEAKRRGDVASRGAAFTALLRLRQLCCDVRLLGNAGGSTVVSRAAKLEVFGELLQEVVDGGHRVLVFSQFTSLLDLLQEELNGEGIGFQRLDGATRRRGEVVEAFQRGDDPVFLLSLKAGGVGLNLTAADRVIHYDPWWNPAAESQATDRVHRIGQQRSVQIYKLVARETVEERILGLQESKRALMEQMLEQKIQPDLEEIEALLG